MVEKKNGDKLGEDLQVANWAQQPTLSTALVPEVVYIHVLQKVKKNKKNTSKKGSWTKPTSFENESWHYKLKKQKSMKMREKRNCVKGETETPWTEYYKCNKILWFNIQLLIDW